ncbi:ParA family protein [Pseudomonas aeruginosa]|uniref:ParA family protein n=1 Tax=Pseudomonas aeruginosa TaxID=287 RepID=UPI001E628D34|nr:ParA family protein [Pseudomonas aeruginosa]MCC9290075.1 ParA family protein [Pseudomonas aeruginosa]UVN19076.1 partitioning protein [Pseudomonas aeruginosa]
MQNNEYGIDQYPFTDFQQLYYSSKYPADCIQVCQDMLALIEMQHNLNIGRIPRGTVEARGYSLDDIFGIASNRRESGVIKPFARPITLSVYVQNGGTAKTSTASNLAIQFSLMALRTQVIDNDPQPDVTTMLGYDPDVTAAELEHVGVPGARAVDGHIANLMGVGSTYSPLSQEEVIKKAFGDFGPHLIAAEVRLDEMDFVLRNAIGSDFGYSFFIEQARNRKLPHCDLTSYVVIIMVNAPSGTLLTRNSMVAADILVCPIRMEKFSYRALSRLAFRLSEYAKEFQRSPVIIAIPTMYIGNRRRIQANLERLTSLFPGQVTQSPHYHNEDYSQSLEDGIPVTLWRQASDTSVRAFRTVISEEVSRIRDVLEAWK